METAYLDPQKNSSPSLLQTPERKTVLKLALFFIALKLFVWACMVFAFYRFPYHQENHFGNKYYPPTSQITVSHIFQTWDTNHYLYLAEQGYSTPEKRSKIDSQIEEQQRLLFYHRKQYQEKRAFAQKKSPQHLPKLDENWNAFEQKQAQTILQLQRIRQDMLNSDAFGPAFPFGTALLQKIFGLPVLWAALLFSNLCSLGVLLFAYLLFRLGGNESEAFWAALFWFSSPFSFVFHLAYTESLFLFLVLGSFYFLQQKRYGLAAVFAFFLPFIRILGILIFLPFAVEWWKAEKSKKSFLFLLFFPLAGFAAYLLVMHLLTGDALIWSKAQEGYVSKHSIFRVFHVLDWFKGSFLHWEWKAFGPQFGLVDKLSVFLFLGGFWIIWRKNPLSWSAYAFCFGFVPAMTSIGLMSYGRYLVAVFPLFFVFGVWFASRNKFGYILITIMILLQGFLAARMGLNYWVC